MLFGWRGLIGVTTAVAGISCSDLVPEITGIEEAVLAAIVRTASIWIAIEVYGRVTAVKTPWKSIAWNHVPFLSLFVSVITNFSVTLYFVYLGVESIETFGRNVAAWVIGDTIGTIVVLVVLIKLRQAYLKWKITKQRGLPSEILRDGG